MGMTKILLKTSCTYNTSQQNQTAFIGPSSQPRNDLSNAAASSALLFSFNLSQSLRRPLVLAYDHTSRSHTSSTDHGSFICALIPLPRA